MKFEFIFGRVVSEENVFENVEERTDNVRKDRRTDAGVTGILLAHP